jgi:hypothetical protein
VSLLRVGDAEVASYVVDPDLDIRLAPRPYLHPVRTLGGTTVTDAVPEDHPWHLGASVAVQDVDGVNVWGGRTYVRGHDYVWRDDHGRVAHIEWLSADDGFAERLRWYDQAGRVLLHERREVSARAAPHGWLLSFGYALSAPAIRDVTLGSPATNGRAGAGYGGFFWRATAGAARAFTASGEGEQAVHGSAEPWLAVTVANAYTLAFSGLTGDDRWFVRTDDYVGVCAALAFARPLRVPAGSTLSRRLSVLVADGALGHDQVRAGLGQPL